MNLFRSLRPDEVEVRVGQVKAGSGFSLLLYKNARCDMQILDETVGPYNWQRAHSKDNANCVVSLYNQETGQWIAKEDTGTESNTEAEKGLASDSFKRACFNWGIGRELYTAPFIWIKTADAANAARMMKPYVSSMEVENGRITSLEICDNTGKSIYSWNMRRRPAFKPAQTKSDETKPAAQEATSESVSGPLNLQQAEFAVCGIESLSDLRAFYKAQANLGASKEVLDFIGSKAKSFAS